MHPHHYVYNNVMKSLDRLGIFPSLIIGAILFLLGLAALLYITNNFWVFDVSRIDLLRATAVDQADAANLLAAANPEILLGFLLGVFLLATGLALPIAYLLNKRFGRIADERIGTTRSTEFLVVLRQAFGFGVWVSFCVWLQMNRTFGIAIAFLVAAVLILFEVLLQIRSRTAVLEEVV